MPRRFEVGLVAALVLPLVAACVSSGQIPTSPSGSLPSPSPTLIDCGVGVPPVKCNPSLYSPPVGITPAPIVLPSPEESSAPMIICGGGFFDSATWATLGDDFGTIECFRYADGTRWVVFGNGLSLASSDPAPSTKGAVIGVFACPTDDISCLDANAHHEFGDFTVTYPLGSMGGKASLIGTADERFLDIANSCIALTLDLNTMNWYHTDAAVLAALHAGKSVPPLFHAPSIVSGSTALMSPPPPSVQRCVVP